MSWLLHTNRFIVLLKNFILIFNIGLWLPFQNLKLTLQRINIKQKNCPEKLKIDIYQKDFGGNIGYCE